MGRLNPMVGWDLEPNGLSTARHTFRFSADLSIRKLVLVVLDDFACIWKPKQCVQTRFCANSEFGSISSWMQVETFVPLRAQTGSRMELGYFLELLWGMTMMTKNC